MNQNEKITKIKSIISSCKTHEQLESCISFVERNEFFRLKDPKDVLLYRWEILYAIQRQMCKILKKI